jgi:hypothetical protein
MILQMLGFADDPTLAVPTFFRAVLEVPEISGRQ